MPRIFVSYRRDNSAYVAATINTMLEQRFGADSVFFDIDTIPLGIDFRKAISDAVGQCDVLLAIIGDRWTEAVDDEGRRRLDDPADFIRLEIESALKRGIPVIPVLVGEASLPSITDLPPSLQDLPFRNAAEIRAGPDLSHHLARLIKGIEKMSQSGQPKRNQAVLRPLQAGMSKLFPVKEPRPSPTASVEPTLKFGGPEKFWVRWVVSSLVLLIFLFVGILVGRAAHDFFGYGFIGSVPTWLVGILLAYKVHYG